ncbi:hypothetical protein [Rhodospirillum rubrum]|uniref:hypothetical protein n=1 Tax=Rhodospirillum rubrum TaxID=1085 RepID=UPI000229D53A|nr:hypothetical protein [Rhodospirillum rubrum]AEO47161.1 hypothetical protein F11_03455 [Rhodospirillum rubrum F11]MBK5953074.1 hypothetical protein [Rhodospirillum rubrum]QXG81153.1 hypothetical protein KUL73_03505 [Rhodospirillum rubrum]HAP99662.1 hypothetical protein [Rhodospirillum rubrum]HCF16620.1 hypothetical protein [Rhodospirillum rubrum]
MSDVKYDLYTFVAGAALESGKPFQLKCNCGGTVTILPPMQEESVYCPSCEAHIKVLCLEGDPGYVIGLGADGKPMLIDVQGSKKTPSHLLSEEARKAMLANVPEHKGK